MRSIIRCRCKRQRRPSTRQRFFDDISAHFHRSLFQIRINDIDTNPIVVNFSKGQPGSEHRKRTGSKADRLVYQRTAVAILCLSRSNIACLDSNVILNTARLSIRFSSLSMSSPSGYGLTTGIRQVDIVAVSVFVCKSSMLKGESLELRI